MFKKLQDLLFEEEEIVEEDVIDEIPAVVSTKPKEAPVVNNDVSMQRIDVTQQVPVTNPNMEARPVTNESVFTANQQPQPIPKPQPQPQPAPRPSLGISIDDVADRRQKVDRSRERAKPKEKRPAVYQFQPVISPIFGVDEKDMNALSTTANTGRTNPESTTTFTQVISPMYGVNNPVDVRKETQDAIDRLDQIMPITEPVSPTDSTANLFDDDIPEFSLDDILKVRDEEFVENNSNDMPSLFDANQSVIDETTVVEKDLLNK